MNAAVIEPDPLLRDLLDFLLREAGYEVSVLQALTDDEFEAVREASLLILRLDGADPPGGMLHRLLHERGGLPCIALTTAADPVRVAAQFGLPHQACLPLPLHVSHLRRLLPDSFPEGH